MKKRRDYSKGGPVRGPGGPRADAINARLSNGEYVLPADTVQQIGLPALDSVRMATHRFADGGMINSFGNDMTATNRMNAAADAMKKDRLGPEPDPDPQQQMMKMLSGLFGGGNNSLSPSTTPTDNRTLGDMGGSSYSPVSNLSSLGGNFAHGGMVRGYAAGGFVTPSELLAQLSGRPMPPGATPPAMGPPTPPGYSPNYDWKNLQNYRNAQAPIGGAPPAAPTAAPAPATSPYQAGAAVGQRVKPVVDAVKTAAGAVGNAAKATGGALRTGMVAAPAIGAARTAYRLSGQDGAEDVINNATLFDPNQTLSPAQFAGATALSGLRDTGNAVTFGLANLGGEWLGQKMADYFNPYDNAPVTKKTAAPAGKSSPSAAAQTYAPTGKPGDVAAPTALPVAPVNTGTPTANMDRQVSPDRLTSPEGQAAIQRGDVLVRRSPTMNAQDYQQTSGGSLVDVMPAGGYADGAQRVVAGNSRQIGVQGQSGALPSPRYQTDYTIFGQNGKQGTASITGPNQRQGGGTISVMDQGNGGTVDGNVAALNRQIEAMRSLRETQNPGITTGTGAFAPQQGLPEMDPFSGYGGDQRRQEYESLMRQAATDTRLTAKQRAAMMEAAQGMVTPGLAQMKQQGAMYGQQLDANQRQQAAQLAAQHQANQLGIDQQKNNFEQQKWAQQYGVNQLNAVTGAQQRGAQTQESQLRAQGLASTQQLLRAYQQLSAQNPEDKRLNQLREWIMLSQRRNEPADPIAELMNAQSTAAATPQ